VKLSLENDIIKNNYECLGTIIEDVTVSAIKDADMRLDVLSERLAVCLNPEKNVDTLQLILCK